MVAAGAQGWLPCRHLANGLWWEHHPLSPLTTGWARGVNYWNKTGATVYPWHRRAFFLLIYPQCVSKVPVSLWDRVKSKGSRASSHPVQGKTENAVIPSTSSPPLLRSLKFLLKIPEMSFPNSSLMLLPLMLAGLACLPTATPRFSAFPAGNEVLICTF